MEENIESPFEQFDKTKIIRRKILPWWIKFFCWLFMAMGVAGIIGIIFGALGNQFQLSVYGFETTVPISIIGFLIIAIMVYKGIVAYSLWFEKDYAINLGKIDAICGITLCIISMLVMPLISDNNSFSFRLEILLLIPYFIKLNRIEYEWDNLEKQ